MNGDGLLDPVQILAGRVDYQLNLGFGQWSPIVSVTGLPFSQQNDVDLVELEDINGDGIDDAVVVQGGTVRFAINRNGAFFDAVQTIDDVEGAPLPTRSTDTAVLYADMNGNGSNDIVWIPGPSAGASAGHVIYLELFPLRANLLTHIENSLGLVTDVSYSTAARERARSGDIAPGAPALRGWRALFWVLDQIDCLLGIVVVTALAGAPLPVSAALTLVAVALVVHPTLAALMVLLGLKDRVG